MVVIVIRHVYPLPLFLRYKVFRFGPIPFEILVLACLSCKVIFERSLMDQLHKA